MKKLGLVVVVLALVALGLWLSGYGARLAGWAFLTYNSPSSPFDPTEVSPAPDYGDDANWAALPGRLDAADLVPKGVEDPGQTPRPVDVFFIHPTGYLKAANWTSPMDPDSGTEENTQWMMANQASAYNGCCNVYAPRYREATIFSYFGDEATRDEVLGFAYNDVLRAFTYYLQHYNQGKPFIIASHSQGSHHGKRLLKEEIDPSALRDQLVAAYLIGAVLIPLSPAWFDSLSHIGACQSAEDLQCVVHWDTMPDGADPIERTADSLCTNPLSWQVNEALAESALNAGAVVPTGTYNLALGRSADESTGQQYRRMAAPMGQHTWAQCRDGSLFVAVQQDNGFQAMGSGNLGSYHGLDYALFYMNIRDNAMLRAQRYVDRRGLAANR